MQMMKVICCRPFVTIIHAQLPVISDELCSCYVKVTQISFLFVRDDNFIVLGWFADIS